MLIGPLNVSGFVLSHNSMNIFSFDIMPMELLEGLTNAMEATG